MGFMKIIRAGKHLCHLYIAFKSFHSVKIHINDFCPFIVVVPALTTRNNKVKYTKIITTFCGLSHISLLVHFLQVDSVQTVNLILYCANAQDALLNEHFEHCISFPIDPATL